MPKADRCPDGSEHDPQPTGFSGENEVFECANTGCTYRVELPRLARQKTDEDE